MAKKVAALKKQKTKLRGNLYNDKNELQDQLERIPELVLVFVSIDDENIFCKL